MTTARHYLDVQVPREGKDLVEGVTRVTWTDSVRGHERTGIVHELLSSMFTVIDDNDVIAFVNYKTDAWKIVD